MHRVRLLDVGQVGQRHSAPVNLVDAINGVLVRQHEQHHVGKRFEPRRHRLVEVVYAAGELRQSVLVAAAASLGLLPYLLVDDDLILPFGGVAPPNQRSSA